jgi:hypothetical protein
MLAIGPFLLNADNKTNGGWVGKCGKPPAFSAKTRGSPVLFA